MSSAMLHDRPLSLCNNRAVTAASSTGDAAFPTNNPPARHCSARLKDGFSLSCPVGLSAEKQLTRNHGCCLWKAVKGQPRVHRAANAPHTETSELKIMESWNGLGWKGP